MFVCRKIEYIERLTLGSQLYSASLYDMSLIHVYDIDSDTWYGRWVVLLNLMLTITKAQYYCYW